MSDLMSLMYLTRTLIGSSACRLRRRRSKTCTSVVAFFLDIRFHQTDRLKWWYPSKKRYDDAPKMVGVAWPYFGDTPCPPLGTSPPFICFFRHPFSSDRQTEMVSTFGTAPDVTSAKPITILLQVTIFYQNVGSVLVENKESYLLVLSQWCKVWVW